jgi:hypothetical protein
MTSSSLKQARDHVRTFFELDTFMDPLFGNSSSTPRFVLHLYPEGMLITRDPKVVEKVRKEDLDSGNKRPFEGSELRKAAAVHYEPVPRAIYFIHTDFMAELLKTREAQYLVPCGTFCMGSYSPCRIALVALIQLRIGVDCGWIVGEYLAGKGYPGKPVITPYSLRKHATEFFSNTSFTTGWVDKEKPKTWTTVKEWFDR